MLRKKPFEDEELDDDDIVEEDDDIVIANPSRPQPAFGPNQRPKPPPPSSAPPPAPPPIYGSGEFFLDDKIIDAFALYNRIENMIYNWLLDKNIEE